MTLSDNVWPMRIQLLTQAAVNMCAALSDAREVNVLDYVRERADQIAQLMTAVDNVEPIGGQVRGGRFTRTPVSSSAGEQSSAHMSATPTATHASTCHVASTASYAPPSTPLPSRCWRTRADRQTQETTAATVSPETRATNNTGSVSCKRKVRSRYTVFLCV
jgi:hypothetical protein